jgi:hypothetical protein
MRLITPAASLLLAAAWAPSTFAASTPVSPAEIKATFGTGKPFTANSTTGGASFTFVLKPDGTATQMSKGANTAVISGTWRVNDKGYCSKWGGNAEHCYTVEKNGTRYDIKDAAGHVISRWTL